MSEMKWEVAHAGQDYYRFIVQQDLRFQAAMRQELERLANDRGLRLVRSKPDEPKDEPEDEPKDVEAERVETEKKWLIPKAHWKTILEEVSEKHGVSIIDIRSARRDYKTARARHEAAWRMRHETDLSSPQIAVRLGGRDHTTILHSIKRHQERIDKGEEV